MTLRIAAVLALGLGVTGFMGFLHLLGEGPFARPAARHMRAMKDRRTAPRETESIAVARFGTLPYHAPLAGYEPIERQGIVMEGYVKHMLRAMDGDIHLEFTADPPVYGTEPLYATAEITPQWQHGAARRSFESLREAFRSGSGGDATRWRDPPRRVRLTGWFMYDFQFESRRPDLTRAPIEQRVSGWEMHPVTKIEVWNDTRATYVEVPR